MQQIFWNLLSNAVKFTPKDGRIQVRLQRINSHVEVAVSDNGRGVDAKLLPFIFERFRQGDSSTTREHGGLGLGLAIVRHLVELHGGVVQAYSDGPGKGTEFIVQLPIMVSARALEPGEERVHPTAGGNFSGGVPALAGLRVLVVDDERDAREIVSVILGEAGAEIATASSTREALDRIDKWKPDILISDIGMPGQSGHDLIRMVRALPADQGGQTPAIALTAYARTQDRLKILSAGFQMHVPKPIEPIELATVVASLAKRL
jgi:CheY-like chemotaxis protein